LNRLNQRLWQARVLNGTASGGQTQPVLFQLNAVIGFDDTAYIFGRCVDSAADFV
jgi:hypothetical protein